MARVGWAETASETFVARHDERDAEDVERVLAQLEYARERVERQLDVQLGRRAGGGGGGWVPPAPAAPPRRGAPVPGDAAAADQPGRAPLRGRLGGRAR